MKAFLAIMLIAATALAGCASDDTEPACTVDCDQTTDSTVDNTGNQTTGTDPSKPTPGATDNSTPLPVNAAPRGQLKASQLEGTVGSPISFSINFTDDSEGAKWTLDVDGDGVADATGAENGTYDHVYETEGAFIASLNVTDGEFHNVTSLELVISAPAIEGPCGAEPEPCKVDEDLWAEFWSDGTCRAKGAVGNAALGWIHDRPGAGSPAGTGYVTGGGTWLYEESNDMPGLQLGGRTAAVSPPIIGGGETAAYADCANPDTLIF